MSETASRDSRTGSKRRRSSGTKPNVLCLGVSYPCLAGQLAARGVPPSPIPTTHDGNQTTAAAVISSVQDGVLTQMDGRDLLRCVETEKACNVNVFCVSREQAAVYREDRHLDANFNRSSSFIKVLKRQFDGRRFQQVVLDWFWIPPGWDDSHWSRSFFVSTLSLLAREGLLEEDGRVFLPFCFHCFKEVIGSFESLRLYYNVSFLRKDELDTICLWKGTNRIDPRTMQDTLGKTIQQEEVYCTFGPRHVQSTNEKFVSRQELLDVVGRLEDFHSVRFIALDLIDKTSRDNDRQGTIVGLQDPSTIQRGFTSPNICGVTATTMSSATKPMRTKQPTRSRRRLFTRTAVHKRSRLTECYDNAISSCPTEKSKRPKRIENIDLPRVVTPSSHRRSPRLRKQSNVGEQEDLSLQPKRKLFPSTS